MRTTSSFPDHRVRLLGLVVIAVVAIGAAALVVTRSGSEPEPPASTSAPLGAAGGPSASGAGSAPASGFPVELGDLALGGRVDSPVESLPGPGLDERTYTFEVAEGGGRLRAALDLSNRDDCLSLQLIDPNGITIAEGPGDYPVVCPSGGRSGQSFAIELAVADAAPGRWTAQVLGEDVRGLHLRLRATVDPEPVGAAGDLLSPDLVPWLPWEFGFAAPVSDHPGTAHDRENGPGDPTVSCHPEEEPDDTHCLRFSAGVYNAGDGPMVVVFRDDAAFQHVYRADTTPLDHTDNERSGAFEERPAGRGEWHPFHEHRHLSEFVLYELFAVTDAGGSLAPLDTGGKHGYCTFSQHLQEWDAVAADPQYASFPDGPFCDAAMNLERGWGDLYRWQRPGQYLAYDGAMDADGSMTAGRYLVRLTIDPEDHIAETDEGNNVGYALIEVIDGGGPGRDTVAVCEQGMGSDPWDPAAEVVADRFAWVPADEPARCD
jgi:hypothetical protein